MSQNDDGFEPLEDFEPADDGDGWEPLDDEGDDIKSQLKNPSLGGAARNFMGAYERYAAAPARAGFQQAAKNYDPFSSSVPDFVSGFAQQFGEDPRKAPTSKSQLRDAGIELSEKPLRTFQTGVDKAGKPTYWPNISAQGVAETAMDIAQDPAMFVPVETVARGIGKGAMGTARAMEGASEWGAKKLARTVADVPEAATERYIRNPNAVNNASSTITPHVERWNEMVEKLRNNVLEGSAESRAALEGKQFQLEDIGDVFEQVKNEIIRESEGVQDPGIQQRLAALEQMRQAYAPKFETVDSGYLNLDGTPGRKRIRQSPQTLSGNRVKNLVQSLQRGSNFSKGGNDFIELSDIDKNKAMGVLNRKLKDNPDYAEIMKGVADDMDLLNRSAALGKTDNALEGLFRNFGKTRENPVNLIREVDQRLGTNFYDELLNTTAKRSFENTNANGARRTLMGFGAGSPAWAMMNDNPVLAALTQAATTGVGFAADKYGGSMVKGAVRGMTFPAQKAREIAESLSQRLPRDSKYWKMLTTAASQGPRSLVVIHQSLMSKDPEYRSHFENQP